MPNDSEYAEVAANLKKHGNKVDVIISHAAPDETMQMFVQTGVISNRFPQEMRLNLFLENVCATVQHSHYYFAHMHLDQELFRNQIALYYNVYELKTGTRKLPQSSEMA